MAWIVGLASPEEIAAIRAAGYSVKTTAEIKNIEAFAKSEDDEGIAVFVDYNVQDLLDMKGEG